MKTPYILALKLNYSAISKYRALYPREINIVLKCPRQSTPLITFPHRRNQTCPQVLVVHFQKRFKNDPTLFK